jgi:2-polyprenyl-3-methyl-5-hydroxy-6-metoxy-1,4-benzoquinol methylase
VPDQYEHLALVTRRQLAAFPQHEKFLRKRFTDVDASEFEFANEVAKMVRRISGPDLDRMCEDYKWLTQVVVEEEFYFRRNNRYRLSTFAEAFERVYDDREYMARYMRGLLATQLWWSNHTRVLKYFRDRFLATNPAGFSHLEVGPGHGLLLALTANAKGVGSAVGWDISDASLAQTREALDAMGVSSEMVQLHKVNIFDAPNRAFQSITFSEVLEHLEDPLTALKGLRDLLAPAGRLFVHAPVNSPAPDHIYLFRTPEEIRDMVAATGLEIEDVFFEPSTGLTLERARKLDATISAAVIAKRPG